MRNNQRGQAATEYALVVAVLALGLASILAGPWIWQALKTVHATISGRVAE